MRKNSSGNYRRKCVISSFFTASFPETEEKVAQARARHRVNFGGRDSPVRKIRFRTEQIGELIDKLKRY
jgi:predicted ABC-type ATPase